MNSPLFQNLKISMIFAAIVSLLIFSGSATAQEFRYSIGGGAAGSRLTGSGLFKYETEYGFRLNVGHSLSDRWLTEISYSQFKTNNDTSKSGTDQAGSLTGKTEIRFEGARIGVELRHLLRSSASRLNFGLGFGGGLLVWKGVDPAAGRTHEVRTDKLQPTDYAASELLLSAATSIILKPTSRLSLDILAQADYLTGAGAQFEPGLESTRDRWLVGVSLILNFRFGMGSGRFPSIPAQPISEITRPHADSQVDSDGDRVPDHRDNCPNTPIGIVVDSSGCARDSDMDGVPDGLDDCPATPTMARSKVDVFGCEVDTDFDGFADYRDNCPDGPIGALVDSLGCPVDTDGDGVPDGLDDCPTTLTGVAVDLHGCIDLSMLAEPMVLNIDYVPGSFEIDPRNKERLKRLAGLLNFVKDIKLDVNGYTDNIGTDGANRQLSQKRANRVRDYLVTMAVGAERIKAVGLGETNFVASNQTADGRARNRRIEIIFYK